jgi:hypothetical protein
MNWINKTQGEEKAKALIALAKAKELELKKQSK